MKPYLIVAILSVVLSVIVGVLQWKQNERNTLFTTLLLIGSVLITSIIAGYGYISSVDNEKDQKKELVSIINNLKYTIEIKSQADSLENKIEDQHAELKLLRQENNLLHSKLHKSSDEIYNQLTGGNNIPIIFITVSEDIFDSTYQIVDFMVVNRGKYTFKRVDFEMEDDWPEVQKIAVTNENIGARSLPRSLYKTKFASSLRHQGYFFEVRWENGQYHGKISFEKPEGSRAYIARVKDAWDSNVNHLPDAIKYIPTNYR